MNVQQTGAPRFGGTLYVKTTTRQQGGDIEDVVLKAVRNFPKEDQALLTKHNTATNNIYEYSEWQKPGVLYVSANDDDALAQLGQAIAQQVSVSATDGELGQSLQGKLGVPIIHAKGPVVAGAKKVIDRAKQLEDQWGATGDNESEITAPIDATA